jgi:hypothetical protein
VEHMLHEVEVLLHVAVLADSPKQSGGRFAAPPPCAKLVRLIS